MSTWTKRLLWAGAVLLFVGVVGAVWFTIFVSKQRRDWRAEAAIEIAAPPNVVIAEIADLKRWPKWSAWTRDAEDRIQRTYDGPPSGAGATLHWKTPPTTIAEAGTTTTWSVKVSKGPHPEGAGAGSMRIVSAGGESGVELETTYEGSMILASSTSDASSKQQSSLYLSDIHRDFVIPGSVRVEATATGSRVRWIERGDFGDGFGVGLVAMAMRDMIEERHTEILALSLEGLKRDVETPR